MPNGLIDDASLRVHPEGFALALTIPWYRSLWLSSVTTLRLTFDGVEVPEEDLAFELDGVRYGIADLPQQSDVLWYLQSHPLLIVRRDAAGRSSARRTRSSCTGSCGCPTCRSRPGEDGGPGLYVPNIVHQRLTLTATDHDAAAARARRPDVPPAPEATDADPFQLGLTLYSASAEFRAGWFDFDGLLDRVAELGIGPGIEIVASQVLPTYPVVSDEFVDDLAGGVRPARLRRQLVRGQPRHGQAARPRHDARRGVRGQRAAVPRRQEARLPAGAHPVGEARPAAPPAAGRRRPRPQARLRDPRADGTERARDHEGARPLRRARLAAARLRRRLLVDDAQHVADPAARGAPGGPGRRGGAAAPGDLGDRRVRCASARRSSSAT